MTEREKNEKKSERNGRPNNGNEEERQMLEDRRQSQRK